MIERSGMPRIALATTLLLFVASRACGHPVNYSGQQLGFLERTADCKSVSIPANSVCGPGLVCNPSSGTCVPDGAYAYKLKKSVPLNKIFSISTANSLDKLSLKISPFLGKMRNKFQSSGSI